MRLLLDAHTMNAPPGATTVNPGERLVRWAARPGARIRPWLSFRP